MAGLAYLGEICAHQRSLFEVERSEGLGFGRVSNRFGLVVFREGTDVPEIEGDLHLIGDVPSAALEVEGGAQGVVMIDCGVESLFESRAVELAVEDEGGRFVEGAGGFVTELAGKPDFLLGFGKGKLALLSGCSGWNDWRESGKRLRGACLEARRRASELGLAVDLDGSGFFEEASHLQFGDRFFKGPDDVINVVVGVGGGDVGGKALENEDTALAKMEEEEVAVFAVLAHAHKEAGVESGEADGNLVVDHELVHGLVEAFGLGIEVGPELGALLFEVGENGVGSGDPERMAHEGASEESNVAFGEGVVAVFPVTTIEGVHVLGLCRPRCR